MAAVDVMLPSQAGGDSGMDVDHAPSSTTDSAAADGDLYTRLKALQRQLEFLEIQVGLCGCLGAHTGGRTDAAERARALRRRRPAFPRPPALPQQTDRCPRSHAQPTNQHTTTP